MSVNIIEYDDNYNNIKEKDIDIENFIINDFSDLNDLDNNDDLFKTKTNKINKNLHLFTVTKFNEKNSLKINKLKNKNNNNINNSDTNSILSTNINYKENESILSSKYFLNLSERMKIKKEKAKILLDKKTNRNEHNSISLIENNKKISKKELKMLRNRLSAQKSRDRKKKEFDKLKQLTEDLINENNILKNKIKNNENKFYQINNTFQYLCKDCKEIIKKHNNEENFININDNCINNKNNLSFKNKCTLITGLLTIICLLGTYFTNYENNNINNKRILQQHFIELNKYNLNNNNNNNFNYKKELNDNNKILPFKIEKDYSIRNKKNNNNNNNNKYLTHNSMVPINYPLEEYYENNNHLDKQNNINLPTLFCTDFYLGKNSSDEFFNTIYNNNNQIKNSISQFNLNIEQQPKLSFNGTDAIIKLIVPSDYNNLIQKNIRKHNKEYFKLSCKIIDIIKEYR